LRGFLVQSVARKRKSASSALNRLTFLPRRGSAHETEI
jgi:hypothetical protein